MNVNNILTPEEKRILDKKAERYALDFRKKFKLGMSPIDNIFSLDVAKEFLLLKFPNDKKVSGAYIEKMGREKPYRCIYINTIEPMGRQNFSFAHELFHAFFEKSNDVLSVENEWRHDPIEFCATRFASHLLMPRNHLKKELVKLKLSNEVKELLKPKSYTKFNINMEQIFDLQMIYGVSFTALVYTIMQLDDKKLVPNNIEEYIKYVNEEYWNELTELTERYDSCNKLNSTNPVFEWPEEFKHNIEKNLSQGLVSKEDVEDIYDFFDE